MSRRKRRENDTPPLNVTTAYTMVRREEFEQILDEWAEVVYLVYSQLCENESLVSETSNPYGEERTGTDGT